MGLHTKPHKLISLFSSESNYYIDNIFSPKNTGFHQSTLCFPLSRPTRPLSSLLAGDFCAAENGHLPSSKGTAEESPIFIVLLDYSPSLRNATRRTRFADGQECWLVSRVDCYSLSTNLHPFIPFPLRSFGAAWGHFQSHCLVVKIVSRSIPPIGCMILLLRWIWTGTMVVCLVLKSRFSELHYSKDSHVYNIIRIVPLFGNHAIEIKTRSRRPETLNANQLLIIFGCLGPS